MNRKRLIIVALTLAVVPGSFTCSTASSGRTGSQRRASRNPMSFFITSAPKATAPTTAGSPEQAYCQQLGTAAGRSAPVTWHAY